MSHQTKSVNCVKVEKSETFTRNQKTCNVQISPSVVVIRNVRQRVSGEVPGDPGDNTVMSSHLAAEWGTLVGPDPSIYCALIG